MDTGTNECSEHDESAKRDTQNTSSIIDYSAFIGYRQKLQEVAADQSRSFDKHVLTLASGAIGLSFFYLKDITARHVVELWSLYLSWAALALCLATTLISFLVSRKAYQEEIARWDAKYRNRTRDKLPEAVSDISVRKQNKRTVWTKHLSIISLVTFIIGIIFLGIFVAKNSLI